MRHAMTATSARPGSTTTRYSNRCAADGSAISTAIVPAGSMVTPATRPLTWSSPGTSPAGNAVGTGEWGMKAMTSTATARQRATM